MKQRTIFTLTMHVLFTSIFLFSCSKNKDMVTNDPDGAAHSTGSIPANSNYAARIGIERNGFNPADITIMQSGSVLWINGDNQVHTVTGDDGSFDSGDIAAGGSFTFTFTAIGPHTYHCKYHAEQTGIVKCVTK